MENETHGKISPHGRCKAACTAPGRTEKQRAIERETKGSCADVTKLIPNVETDLGEADFWNY